MRREKFLAQLKALADEAEKSNDEVVRQSAGVLLGLCGSIVAGDGFFDSFVDNVRTTIRNQRYTIDDIVDDIVEHMIGETRR